MGLEGLVGQDHLWLLIFSLPSLADVSISTVTTSEVPLDILTIKTRLMRVFESAVQNSDHCIHLLL